MLIKHEWVSTCNDMWMFGARLYFAALVEINKDAANIYKTITMGLSQIRTSTSRNVSSQFRQQIPQQ